MILVVMSFYLPHCFASQGSKAALGFRLPQTVTTAPVFGDVTSQTNGAPTTTTTSQDTSPKPFGFGFGGTKNETQQDQNLFFQCMNQNSGSSPSLTTVPTQLKDTNYFTAVSESLSKEPPCLFKPTVSTEGLKKPEQPKVPETHPTGNGVLTKSTFQGIGASPGGRGSGLSLTAPSGIQSTCKKDSDNGTSPGGLGMQTGFNTSDSHQNLFLQASKEPTNPFLAYGEKTSHTSFAGLSAAEPQTLGPASDSKPNLFTMTEPPKGILSSPFPAISAAASPSSSSSPAPASSQSEGTVIKEDQGVGEMPTSTSGYPLFGSTGSGGFDEVPVSFDQSPSQKFTLEERSQSSKRDSESSSNSDLSDLSDNEEGPEKGQVPQGPPHPVKDGAVLQKMKVQGAAKSRPRNKPFKGKSSPLVRTSESCVVINKINCDFSSPVGQSVLKDQSKVRRLKQSGESFLQDGSCINVAPHLHKCRECRLERYRKYRNTDDDSDEEDDPNVACRFFHFRRYEVTMCCFLHLRVICGCYIDI